MAVKITADPNFHLELALCSDTRNIYEGINMMVKTLKLYKVKTLCEHCKKEFENVWICKMDSIIGIKYVLLCAGCQKLIRISSYIDFNETIVTPYIIFNELKNPVN